ncbi:septum formation inhibitor Maf [Flavivirga eckloniae]|uniref:Septum formation inhibitor Maf n=1 Tax=Flavivirga eckloniae TaxID=1803846 RepID=A0A2K9PLM8_9FLAO|nr:septum formation inhibitor Maf [Flavivirga eckloniae]AUP77973.1 septum formation inhibitor Maf [Flavivirga eckloniae]
MIQSFKKIVKVELAFYTIIAILSLFASCKKETASKTLAHHLETPSTIALPSEEKEPSKAFKNYWYAGEAEISSYKLEQARYGEIRSGQAVLIYVTEDFLPDVQVKADGQSANNVSVLKLNATKKFNTGIYPYSIMQSTFYPVSNNKHAIKISSSMQEWCGHVYSQLNNKAQFEVMSHSYFEGEADKSFNLDKTILENELWTQLRIDPKSLPTGDIEIIPSFEYTRLRHVPIKAYKASATMQNNVYSISYPELNRTLSITFNPNFPYDILSWEEAFKSGFGANAKVLKTKATKLKTIKSAYWGKNSNKDEILRKELQLK